MAQAFLIGGNGTSLPNGGTTGQVLKKNSNSSYDVTWGEVFPEYSTSDDGKVLRVSTNTSTQPAIAQLEWGSGLPDYSEHIEGQALVLKNIGTQEVPVIEPQWSEATPLHTASDVNKVLMVKVNSSTSQSYAEWANLNNEQGVTAYTANNVKINPTSSGNNYYVTGVASSSGTISSEGLYRNSNIYINGTTGVLMGAAWNDYAECRQGASYIKPGMCVIEAGDDTVKLSNEYGCGAAYIVSDTYGMAIGETDIAKIPVALSGRVLAYTEENRDLYKNHIGSPVGSGPHGKIVLLDKQFVYSYPWTVIGVVASVPEYNTWNGVKVDGRIWIKVK